MEWEWARGRRERRSSFWCWVGLSCGSEGFAVQDVLVRATICFFMSYVVVGVEVGCGSRLPTFVVRACSPGEYLKQGEVGGVFGRLSQGLDVWCLEELGEDIGVRGRGSLGDQVGGGAG